MRKRTRWIDWVILAASAVSAAAALSQLGGCAVGRALDTGAPMVGVTTETVNDGIVQVGRWGGLVGSILGVGGPAAAVAGGLTWMVQSARRRRAENEAWEESKRETRENILLGRTTNGGTNASAG